MTPSRTIVLSDLQLGRPAHRAIRAESLRTLWAGADRVIVAGDIRRGADRRSRALASKMLCRLQDLCDADGVDLITLAGDHGPILDELRSMDVAGGLVHLTHGDVLNPAASSWTTHADELAAWHRKALRMVARRHRANPELVTIDGDSPEGARRRLMEYGRSAAFAMWSRQTLPRRAAAHLALERPDARFMVFGNAQAPGLWQFGPRVVINTGGLGSPGRPRAVLLSPTTLAVHGIECGSHGASLSARPLASFPLVAADPPIELPVDLGPLTTAPAGPAAPPLERPEAA